MNKIFLLLISAFLFTTANAQNTETSDVPSIVLKDLSGKDVDISSYAKSGKITIISFWATWCSPCKKELENTNELLEEWKKKYDLQLVGVSVDDSRGAMKVKPYIDGKKWKFDILLDVNQDCKRVLNFPNVPYTLLIDKNGKIVYKHIGYQEGDEFVLEDHIKQIK
ncbi:MAG: TlpA disulfide reductase family protein [Bacteroidetes bacterium]|nr:TlpA disulfide reductase family protein [Bacteroidota bacterium]